jgi:hypothetical protein
VVICLDDAQGAGLVFQDGDGEGLACSLGASREQAPDRPKEVPGEVEPMYRGVPGLRPLTGQIASRQPPRCGVTGGGR